MPEAPTLDRLAEMGLESLDQPLVAIAVGVLLLAFGRRIYWLLVGLAGFVLGYSLVLNALDLGEGPLPLIIGVVAGLVCGAIVVLFQKVAVATVGFVAGGLVMFHLSATLDLDAGYWIWLAALLAGIVGALLARSLFEMALVVFSAIAGAALVVMALAVSPPAETLLFVVLAAAGVLIQLAIGRRSRTSD